MLKYCEHSALRAHRSKETLTVERSAWNEEFKVTGDDCRLMMKHELLFLDDLMVDAIRKYQASVMIHADSKSN